MSTSAFETALNRRFAEIDLKYDAHYRIELDAKTERKELNQKLKQLKEDPNHSTRIVEDMKGEVGRFSYQVAKAGKRASEPFLIAHILRNANAFLLIHRGGHYQEPDIKAAIRCIEEEFSKHASLVVPELRAIAIEARAAQKDATLREVFKSKVEVVAREIHADIDHYEVQLKAANDPESEVSTSDIIGLAEERAKAQEILLNVVGAAEVLISDKKLDLSSITVAFAMQNTQTEIARRAGDDEVHLKPHNDYALSLMQHVATETKNQAKVMKLTA